MNENIQLFGAYLSIGLHILFALLGLICIAFKQVQVGFAFLTSGTTAPIVVALALIGLVPTFWSAIFWICVVIAVYGLTSQFLAKKWKPKQEEKTAAA